MLIAGIYAGSVYGGQNTRSHQRFPGLSHHDGSTIVVKTHYPMLRQGAGLAESVTNAIILIRNPLNVFKAEFKRENFKHYGPDQWPPPGMALLFGHKYFFCIFIKFGCFTPFFTNFCCFTLL